MSILNRQVEYNTIEPGPLTGRSPSFQLCHNGARGMQILVGILKVWRGPDAHAALSIAFPDRIWPSTLGEGYIFHTAASTSHKSQISHLHDEFGASIGSGLIAMRDL